MAKDIGHENGDVKKPSVKPRPNDDRDPVKPSLLSASPWEKAGEAISRTFTETVQRLVQDHNRFAKGVQLNGRNLTSAEVAAVAYQPSTLVNLDSESYQQVARSADWILDQVQSGADIYGVTTGFGATSHVRTRDEDESAALQNELIRFLNAGYIGAQSPCLPAGETKAAMLVRINSLMQGFSGIRWEVLEVLTRLMNANLVPKVPLRGTITASGDLVPLSYVAAVLAGRPNARVSTWLGNDISGVQAMRAVGVEAGRIVLQPKEGLALCNGTAVGAAVAARVCYEANLLVFLEVVLSAMFCEAMLGDPEFADPLIHQLRHHPGQIEAAAIMAKFLHDSQFLARVKVRNLEQRADGVPKGARQDRYALRTAPQWLGPQIEVVRTCTATIERELNAVTDNPLIDVVGGRALHGGNFQGTPIGVSMDNLRLALAQVGKLMFAQFSELVCGQINNGLPENLSANTVNPSLDYGLKGAEIAMASYTAELQWLAAPVTAHIQSAEQGNQDVNSMGLVAAQKTGESIHILKLMTATYLCALCQATDLRVSQDASFDVTMNATYPIYRFVRVSANTTLLKGEDYHTSRSPGEDITEIVDKMGHDLGGVADLLLELTSVLV